MNPLLLFNQTNFSKTNWWKLKINTYGYKDEIGNDLVTEIAKGRCFRIIESDLKRKKLNFKTRYLVQLFEDGYLCWVNIVGLQIEKCKKSSQEILQCDESFIQKRIPRILNWIYLQSQNINIYKWGGTLGPDFDCSGLIQTAFMKENIYIPRDSYQIMAFCKHLFDFPGNIELLQKGDLLFFGEQNICNHIAIYFEKGYYYHSSGIEYGRNGIAIENLYESKNDDIISNYYRSKLICAGRVIRSYRWDRTLR